MDLRKESPKPGVIVAVVIGATVLMVGAAFLKGTKRDDTTDEERREQIEELRRKEKAWGTKRADEAETRLRRGYSTPPPPPATRAPRCVKGKPCGNSCIAVDKTCHK